MLTFSGSEMVSYLQYQACSRKVSSSLNNTFGFFSLFSTIRKKISRQRSLLVYTHPGHSRPTLAVLYVGWSSQVV